MLHRAWTEYCNMIHENSKRYRGHPHDLVQFWEIWKIYSPGCPKNTFSEVFRIKFYVFNVKWTKWSLLTYCHRLRLCYKFLCNFTNFSVLDFCKNMNPRLYKFVIFSKGTQPFDFMKTNVIWKLTYKKLKTNQVKLMEVWSCFSKRREWDYFKLVGLIVNNMERINTKW